MIGLIEELMVRVERLEKQVADGGLDGYVNQKDSPLGPKVHARVVKRLVSQGDERAAIVNSGRTYLLSRSALKEELHRSSSPSISSGAASEDDAFYRDLLNRSGVEVTHGKRDTGQSR